eukprot:Nitzschia sp. Nitz4//scaffold31_size150131//55715//56096//NITZ4_002823-RA/size150131-augustus-gene-0.16-mRNA-1//-1//CDS//3329547644//2490//frame0
MASQNWFLRVLGFGPYFRRRSGDLEGMFVASTIGAISGVYIFKPLFDEMEENRKAREAREAAEAAASTTPAPKN